MGTRGLEKGFQKKQTACKRHEGRRAPEVAPKEMKGGEGGEMKLERQTGLDSSSIPGKPWARVLTFYRGVYIGVRMVRWWQCEGRERKKHKSHAGGRLRAPANFCWRKGDAHSLAPVPGGLEAPTTEMGSARD